MIGAKETIKKYRVREQDFIRERALSFSMVIIMILRGHKLSLQNTVNKVFSSLKQVWEIVSASAYSQARKKLKAELFIELNEIAVEGYYEEYGAEGEVKLWRGHRLLGVDGTYINLPDNEETRREYSVRSNKYEIEYVQALGSVLYDVRNDIGINAEIGKFQAEKNFIFEKHLKKLKAGDILILDRGYADFSVMVMLILNKIEFVIRFGNNCALPIREFWQSKETETIIKLKATRRSKQYVEERGLDTEITVRFIKVVLDNGEIEVLATSLLDSKSYPAQEFKQVYGWRWCQETYYNRIKNIFEIERFSGQSVLSIQQDFHGIIFLATLEAILIKPSQETLTQTALANNNNNPVKVNRAGSYISLVDNVVELLNNKTCSVTDTLAKLEFLFAANPSHHREGRTFPRNMRTKPSRKLFCNKYLKRIIS